MSTPSIKPKAGDVIVGGITAGKESKPQAITTVTTTVVNNKSTYAVVGAKDTISTDEDHLVLSHVLANGQQFFVKGK